MKNKSTTFRVRGVIDGPNGGKQDATLVIPVLKTYRLVDVGAEYGIPDSNPEAPGASATLDQLDGSDPDLGSHSLP